MICPPGRLRLILRSASILMSANTASRPKSTGKSCRCRIQFKNGDIVSIVTRPSATPSLDWLQLAKSSHARTKIKAYFRRQRYGANVIRGREMLQEELSRLGLPVDILREPKKLLPIAQALNKEAVDDFYAAIGFGDLALGVVVNRLRTDVVTPVHDEGEIKLGRKMSGEAKLSIAPGGVDGVAISRAKCCLPLPGDMVIGYVSRGKGMVLHREGCVNVSQWRQKEPERLVEVDWQADPTQRFETGVVIETVDRVGLLRDVSEIFSENRTFITGINTRSNVMTNTAVMRIDFESSSLSHMETMIKKLHSLEDLLSIHRLGVGAEEPIPVSRESVAA